MDRKYLKITIIAILLICVYATIANALSFSVTMSTANTYVEESKEFGVTIKVSNLDVGTNGINKLVGYIKFDNTVFESINKSSFDVRNGWTLSDWNLDTGKVTFTKTTYANSEEEVVEVFFKTKAGVTGKEGTIRFTEVNASNSQQTIKTSEASTVITVGTPPANVANVANVATVNITPKNTTNNTVNNTVNNVVNNTVANVNNVVKNTASNSDIPYTGAEDTIIYIVGGLIVIAAIFYIKFEMINKEIK